MTNCPTGRVSDVAIIFRVETEEEFGPYSCEVYENKPQRGAPSYFQSGTGSTPWHPHPSEDGFTWWDIDDSHYFGFDTEADLKEWFFREEKDPEKLEAWDLTIATYDVPDDDVKFGGRQLIFYRREAKLIERRTPTEFAMEMGLR